MDQNLTIIEVFAKYSNYFVIIAMIAVVPFTLIQLFERILKQGLKRSLRVAVVGATRAGKTSLITVVFDHIMSGKIARFASVSGTETIERITAYQKLMASGMSVGPSTDKDVFAYRYFTSRKIAGLISEKIDVEVADFPGEYTEELGASIENWTASTSLYKKEFFSWIVRADRYLLVVDIEPLVAERSVVEVLNSKNSEYAKRVEILFKNAIMQLKQELLDENLYHRPAMLVFTKSDLLLLDEQELEAVYGENGKKIKMNDDRLLAACRDEESLLAFQNAATNVLVLFDGLIVFLRNNFGKSEYVFHSSYLEVGPLAGASDKVVKFSTPFQI